MDVKSYHHGNLRESLIEMGIKIISLEGDTNLSLRKVASACNVSHAAPYAHFKNKEDLINAMQEHVAFEFSKSLIHVIETCTEKEEILTCLGKSYVLFFMDNPHYFSFLFSRTEIMVDFSYNADPTNNYKPYELFRQTAYLAMCAVPRCIKCCKHSFCGGTKFYEHDYIFIVNGAYIAIFIKNQDIAI